MAVRQGEIVGLAGIDGHGQRETLRALAGLTRSTGAVEVAGKRVEPSRSEQLQEGRASPISRTTATPRACCPSLSVRENATVRALEDLAVAGVVQPVKERRVIKEQIKAYNIKTPSSETPIDSPLRRQPAEGDAEPDRCSPPPRSSSRTSRPRASTSARARRSTPSCARRPSDGACVLVCSSDASELEGLCDRVLIFSRGNVVTELAGEDNTERRITESALTATAERHRERQVDTSFAHKLRRFAQSDVAPSVVLALAIVILGVVAINHSEFYLTERNFSLVLPLLAILAVAALGQQMVMMIGGIDLSIGPLMGLIAVVASFQLTPDQTAPGLVVGWVLVIGIAAAVGFTNWFLATILRINPLIATLVTFTLLQGVSLLLRETPGGSFATDITDGVEASVGFVPVVLLLAVALAVGLEFALYRTLFGVKLRGVGSRAAIAAKLGVRANRITLYAYVGCSLLGALAAILLLPQVGSGNAAAGTTYTLATIGAVVLGGASVFGGRGSFIGALLGAALVIQINTVVQFLELSDYWQQYLLGGLTIVAAAFYSKTRASSARS